MESLTDFIDFLSNVGLAPKKTSDIRQTKKITRYEIDGDKGKKNGWYIFEDHGHYSSGIAGSWRTGEKHIFKGKLTKVLTAQERQEFAKKRDAERKARARAEILQHDSVANKCAKIWAAAKPASAEHPYIKKKGVKPDYIRQRGDVLIVPLYKAGALWNLQFISKDGQKRFKLGGLKKGCYHALADRGQNLDEIIVAEGYSTGASIRQALDGAPVVIAFDAYNLKPVVNGLMEKYPNSRIIIAADNDHGKKKNTGIEVAVELSETYGIEWSAPDERPQHDATDWNDAGLDAIKDKFYSNIRRGGDPSDSLVCSESSPTDHPAPPLEWLEEHPPIESYEGRGEEIPIESAHAPQAKEFDYDPDWKLKLITDDKGALVKTMSINAGLIIENSERFRNMFCYDEFSHRKLLVQCPSWESANRFKPRELMDEDYTHLNYALQTLNLKIQHSDLKRCVDAALLKKRRNPAKEYFSSLEWDGVERLDNWLAYYCGCEADDAEYLSLVGRMWLVAAVTRVFRPGAKFDHILILEGGQGAGKSTALKELATIHGNTYFTDSINVNELGTKDGVSKTNGCLIVEFAEMTGLGKADTQRLKQNISIDVDRVRQNYRNETTDFPRQFVMAGTINPDNGYLDDPTGSRRFWPVQVGEKIDIESIKKDKEQIWAEAYALYTQNQPIYVKNEDEPLFKRAQDKRSYIDVWYDTLSNEIAHLNFVQNDDLHRLVSTDKTRWDRRMTNRLASVMTRLGYVNGRQAGGSRKRGWKKI